MLLPSPSLLDTPVLDTPFRSLEKNCSSETAVLLHKSPLVLDFQIDFQIKHLFLPLRKILSESTSLVQDFSGTLFCQWEFQEPKLEVPTIYKAYIRAM